jgi:hypothetical protein
MDPFKKFIPFVKVDSVRREVSGIVTAERPDKDLEVCDYFKSKPYYQKWSEEFNKATEGKSFGNLRAMHGLEAVGKAVEPIHFDDNEKEIVMTFKVVDDVAWKKVDERVYTGFSQGGRKIGEMERDAVHKGCMRYVASPSEISLVDNPCLPDAHFAYVKSDGSVEMRKFLVVEDPGPTRLAQAEETIKTLQGEVALLKTAGAPVTTTSAATVTITTAVAKTKRVAGKDLPASDFAYVGDLEKTETWQLPIHVASYVRNTLARLGQSEGIPAAEKEKVKGRVYAAAKKLGVDVASEQEKYAAMLACMRKTARVYVNKNYSGIKSLNLQELDADLGKMRKGMYEVSDMACAIDRLAHLFCCVCCEQEYELDEDSQLPELLAENIVSITKTFIEMVDEETRELLAQVQAHLGKTAA